MIEYIVGTDFGHGETAAWVAPVSATNPANLPMDGRALKLRDTNILEDMKLPSMVYFKSTGEYSLNTSGGFFGMAHQMKKRISAMNEAGKAHYRAYIRLIVERLLSCNSDILKVGADGPNFMLCMACPTRWNEDEKREYLAFFNEAIAGLNLKFEWIINESDAAYFTHAGLCNPSECVLVVDYGSSTIDYTAMKGGKKISDDEWSNQQLGASIIEKTMMDSLEVADGMTKEEMLAHTDALLRKYNLSIINPLQHLVYYLRKIKEDGYTNMTYDYFEEYSFRKVTGISDFNRPRYAFEGNLISDITEYRDAVRLDLEGLRENVKRVNGGKLPDRIILSGGASIMRWFAELMRNIFECNQVVDRDPAFVVAHGVALYAQAQMKALSDLRDRLKGQDYASIYKSSDKQATDKGISTYSYIPLNKISSDAPVSGNTIRRLFCDFIQGLNSSNSSYCSLVQGAFDANLTSTVKGVLYSVVYDIFRLKPDLGDVQLHMPVQVIDWNTECFEPGGAWYNYFTNAIDASSSRWSFTWDKLRDKSEAKSIAEGVKSRLSEFSKSISIDYPEETVKAFAEEIRDKTLAIGEKLFYEQQLFKTTFVDPA